MKKMTLMLVLCFVSITFCAAQKATDEAPTQMNRVVTMHDEVMLKMGGLVKLVGYVQNKANSSNNENKEKYENAIKNLKTANTSMMKWMHDFGDRFDLNEMLNGKKLTEEKQEWLNEEENKINAIQKQIDSSIQQAEALLGK